MLARLLPGIEGNKEFTEFFNDPKRERSSGWQGFSFVGLPRGGPDGRDRQARLPAYPAAQLCNAPA
jgi:hypothetical protein